MFPNPECKNKCLGRIFFVRAIRLRQKVKGVCWGHLGNLVRAAPSPWLIPLPAAGCRECQQQTQSSWLWASHLEGAPRMMWTLVRKYMWTFYKQKHVNCIAANDANQVLHLHACICWNKISKMQTTPTYPNTTPTQQVICHIIIIATYISTANVCAGFAFHL